MRVFSGKIKNKIKNKIRFAAFALCVIAALVCQCLLNVTNKKDREFDASRRWKSGRQEFAHISVYMSPEEGWTENDRNTLVSGLKMSFQENSITNEDREDNSNGLLKDCFSSEGVMELTNGKNTTNAKVTATGGDFFFFHQMVWLSGFAYSNNDVMKDRAVIDKELAWKLFGGENVAGMPFKINGNTYYVAGVVDTPQTKEEKEVYGEINRAWLPYSAFCKEYQGNDTAAMGPGGAVNTNISSITGTSTEEKTSKVPITCYEIVMPDPVKKWAVNLIKEKLDIENRKIVIVENNERTDLFYVMDNLKGFFYKTAGTQPVAYPYWENAARARDIKREFYTSILIIAVIYPVLLCIRVIAGIYKMADSKIKKRMNKKHSIEI